jgi:hypothetical protein
MFELTLGTYLHLAGSQEAAAQCASGDQGLGRNVHAAQQAGTTTAAGNRSCRLKHMLVITHAYPRALQ